MDRALLSAARDIQHRDIVTASIEIPIAFSRAIPR
jgi:hypothetical protein